jgi:hypothetical protein
MCRYSVLVPIIEGWGHRGRRKASRRESSRPARSRAPGQAPDLWSMRMAAAVVLPLAVGVAALVGWWLYDHAAKVAVPGGGFEVDTLEVVRTTITVAAFVGAVLAGLNAYRKQRLAEAESDRADASEFTRRYGESLTHLGDAQAAVRLGGVYSMARLADDWEDQRQTCIDVLCGYLRMPTPYEAETSNSRAEQEVRATIQRLIRWHVVLDVESSSGVGFRPSWSSCHFDFSGGTLCDMNLNRADFKGDVNFSKITFMGISRFNKTVFRGSVRFDEASFSNDAVFDEVQFEGEANFRGARFRQGGDFKTAMFKQSVDFYGATFSMVAEFKDASFAESVSFEMTQFKGTTSWEDAKFSVVPKFEGAIMEHSPRVTGMSVKVKDDPDLSGVSFLDWPAPNRALPPNSDSTERT